MANKKFICTWGSFESGMNVYADSTQTVSEDFFSEDNGYEPEEIEKIKGLQFGQVHSSEYGNHNIMRIK